MPTAAGCGLFSSFVSAWFLLVPLQLTAASLLGVSPQDEKYFEGSVIACRDGSKTFTKDRLNDGFCDCPDGTDEPGTSACPEAKFYCRNEGDTPQLLFSSRVNDQICDCCDGSDEYDGQTSCPNTCHKDQKIYNAIDDFDLTVRNFSVVNTHERRRTADIQDLFDKLRGLRALVIIELGSVIFAIILFCRRFRSRSKKRYLLKK